MKKYIFGVLALFTIFILAPKATAACTATSTPSITVTSPNGGEVYTAGQQITVKWTSCNFGATYADGIEIDLIHKDDTDTPPLVLTKDTVDDGSEVVTLPTSYIVYGKEYPLGKNFKIWVGTFPSTYFGAQDYSDNYFTINPQLCVVNSFTATPSSIPSGSSSTLSWSTTNCGSVLINGTSYPSNGSTSTGVLIATQPNSYKTFTLVSLIAGCSSTTGYSTTNGQPCSNSKTKSINVTVNPAGDTVLFIGGMNIMSTGTFIPYNDVYRSTDMKTWTLISPNGSSSKFSPRVEPGVAYYKGKYWVISGMSNWNGVPQNDVWNSTDGITWTKVASSVPFANLKGFSTIAFSDQLYVIGGYAYNGFPNGSAAKLWSTSDGMHWKTTTLPFAERGYPAVGKFNGTLYIIGGQNADGSGSADIWTSSDGVTFTKATNTASWDAVYGGKLLENNGTFYFLGGDRTSDGVGTVRKGIWMTTDGKKWTMLDGKLPTYELTDAEDAVAADGALWVGDAQWQAGMINQLWFSPDANTWTQSSNPPWTREMYRFIAHN